jgi:hypothetical protein
VIDPQSLELPHVPEQPTTKPEPLVDRVIGWLECMEATADPEPGVDLVANRPGESEEFGSRNSRIVS